MYQQGNIIFTPDGNSVLSPVGNRVSVFDLVKSVLVPGRSCARKQLTGPLHSNKSFTFAFQNRKNITAIALSPHGNILISVDEGASEAFVKFQSCPLIRRDDTDGRALLVNFRRGVVIHHFNFKKPVNAIEFSPNGSFIAVTHESHVQVWKTPNHLVREFAPFNLHRTYTGHHDKVLSIEWSPDSLYVVEEYLGSESSDSPTSIDASSLHPRT